MASMIGLSGKLNDLKNSDFLDPVKAVIVSMDEKPLQYFDYGSKILEDVPIEDDMFSLEPSAIMVSRSHSC